jgi:hypothetical protein
MWRWSKLAKSMAAHTRRYRGAMMLALPIAQSPTRSEDHDAQIESESTSALSTAPWLQQEFPGIELAILEEIDEHHQGDIPDDVVELLRLASAAIDVASSL